MRISLVLVADFHSPRVSFITALVNGGASVKVAQELARHSDPKLTLNVYTTLGIHDAASALEALPDPDRQPVPAEPKRAVGTCDHSARGMTDPHQLPHQFKRQKAHRGAAERGAASAGKGLSGGCKPSRITALRDPAQPGATSRKSSAAVAQLAEQRFCKPPVDSTKPDPASTCASLRGTPASNTDSSPPETPLDAELQAVIEAWPDLPEAIRAGVVALVKAGGR